MSAIDALSGGLTARTLDQGPPSPPSAAAGAGVGGPEGPRSTLDVFDARLRRTLEAHMQRAENVQVGLLSRAAGGHLGVVVVRAGG